MFSAEAAVIGGHAGLGGVRTSAAARDGPSRPALAGAAGVVTGLAVTVDYPLAAVGCVLFLYALVGDGRLGRAVAYAGGSIVGLLPLFAYNWWAFGSPLHLSYSGFEIQSAGLFGVQIPSLRVALELLLAEKGLIRDEPCDGHVRCRRGAYLPLRPPGRGPHHRALETDPIGVRLTVRTCLTQVIEHRSHVLVIASLAAVSVRGQHRADAALAIGAEVSGGRRRVLM